LAWLNDTSPGHPNLNGAGNYVDAWRHGGTAALLAYHNGYDNVIRWGNALEQWHPDNEKEAGQDYWNNEVGARIGVLARITGMTVDELGDAIKAAFQAGVFQTDAYGPFKKVPLLKVGQMTVSLNHGLVTLPDGSQFDLKNSGVISVNGKDYPVLSVLLKDGTVQNRWTNMEDARTLFKDGVGKWNSEDRSAPGFVNAPPRIPNSSPGTFLNPAPMDPTASSPFGTGGQFAPGAATSTRPIYETRSFVAPPENAASPGTRTNDRVLRGRVASNPATSVFDGGAPAVPYVPPGATFAPGRQDSFGDRFGNWTSPQANAPQTDPSKIRVLSGYVTAPDGSLLPLTIPKQAQRQPGRSAGAVTSQPMPDHPVPPPIFGLPDRSTASSDDMDDWFSRWIKPLMRQ
jgi:hypothetical protein